MKAMTLTEAKAYYTPIIQAEVNRCNMLIESIEETIAEIGEDECPVCNPLMWRFNIRIMRWKSGL